MSGTHEGCSQGKSVRDREGSKHSTAATLERVDSEAAVLPQDFEDTVHARQLLAVVQKSGAKDDSSRSGTLTFNMTHASERGAAARKSRRGSRIAGVEKFVGSRFTLACNTSHRLEIGPILRIYLFSEGTYVSMYDVSPLDGSPSAIPSTPVLPCWLLWLPEHIR